MDSISSLSRRRCCSRFKPLIAGVVGLIIAAIPGTLFYLLWSWCMAQVPATLAWAGLAKIALTLAMVLVGGGATIGLTIVLTTLAVAGIIALLD